MSTFLFSATALDKPSFARTRLAMNHGDGLSAAVPEGYRDLLD
jgi:hypothetical protein